MHFFTLSSAGLIQLNQFRAQACDCIAGIGIQTLLPRHISRQLCDALLQSVNGLLGPFREIAQRVFLHIQPLQHRIGDGLFLTQRWQGRLANLAGLHRFLNRGFGLGGGERTDTQGLFGRHAGLLCFLPPTIQQETFG